MSEVIQKTGIIYCRVSSKEQIEGTSLEMQEKLCNEYSERNDIKVLQVFIERGESAKTANRTEFNKAITFCCTTKRKVNYFIVYKIDRFARNQDDHAVVRANLKRYGTELRSVTEPIDNTATGRLMEGVISSVAEFDNTIRTERTKGGMLERIKQGIWVWGAPIGFYRPHKGSNITPEPHNIPYIRFIFEEYAKRVHSFDSIAKLAGKRGFRTRNGKMPCAQLIEKMVKNPIYCAIIDMWGLRVKGTGIFTEIVSEDLFNRCQGRNVKTKLEPRTIINPDFPLRRSVCLACLSSITGSYSTGRAGKKYPYYHHHKQGCLEAKFIPKETFEQLFVEYLNEITPTVKYEKVFKAVMLDTWQSNYKKFDEENRIARKEVDKLEQDRQRIFELHRSGAYTDQEFLEQKALVNQLIMEKSQLLHENRIEEFNIGEALDYCFQFVRKTAETWLRLKPENKFRFQRNVFPEKINFDGKKFGTKKLASIYALNQEYDGKKSNLVAPTGFEPVYQA